MSKNRKINAKIKQITDLVNHIEIPNYNNEIILVNNLNANKKEFNHFINYHLDYDFKSINSNCYPTKAFNVNLMSEFPYLKDCYNYQTTKN